MKESQIVEVIAWAEEKGILEHGTKGGQHEKTVEEVNELGLAINCNDPLEIKDGIGDTLVTLIIQAHLNDLTIGECLAYALDEIRDRKGQMVNGVFVKEQPSATIN